MQGKHWCLLRNHLAMWWMCFLTGMMCTMKIFVLGVVCFVTMSASPLFLCKPLKDGHFLSLLLFYFGLSHCFANLGFKIVPLCVLCSNLSNLNLGGEISPAIGDLRNLQSMWAACLFIKHTSCCLESVLFSSCLVFLIVLFLIFCIWQRLSRE